MFVNFHISKLIKNVISQDYVDISQIRQQKGSVWHTEATLKISFKLSQTILHIAEFVVESGQSLSTMFQQSKIRKSSNIVVFLTVIWLILSNQLHFILYGPYVVLSCQSQFLLCVQVLQQDVQATVLLHDDPYAFEAFLFGGEQRHVVTGIVALNQFYFTSYVDKKT